MAGLVEVAVKHGFGFAWLGFASSEKADIRPSAIDGIWSIHAAALES